MAALPPKKFSGTRIQPASQARDVIDTYRLCAAVLFLRAEECETFVRSKRFLAVISYLNEGVNGVNRLATKGGKYD